MLTDDDQDRALCEAHCNTASDEYFSARPQIDSQVNRRIFYAGHRKAWIERGEAVRLNVAVPDGWVLIAADAYEAGYGKGLQAAQTGKEIENPWGDEPGREAWSIGYALAKERAPAAPQPAGNHRPDRQWYEHMIQETLDDDFEIGPAFDEKVKDSAAPAAPQPAQPEDGELETRHQMLKSWLVEADASNERLKKHLHRALEIAYTWQPVYATKMDLDTLAHAATDSGFEHHGIKEQP